MEAAFIKPIVTKSGSFPYVTDVVIRQKYGSGCAVILALERYILSRRNTSLSLISMQARPCVGIAGYHYAKAFESCARESLSSRHDSASGTRTVLRLLVSRGREYLL